MKDKNEELWKSFAATGAVCDYLKYKSVSNDTGQKEGKNGSEHSGYNRERNSIVSDRSW